MYPKIDIYVNGEYFCSTCQASSLKKAKEKFLKNPVKSTFVGNGIGTVKAENIHRVVCKYSKES